MKKTRLILFAIMALLFKSTFSQESGNTKVILITLDGFRWQELFTGADPQLIANSTYVNDSIELKERFWKEDPEDRREVLLPFIWQEVSKMGQIHGNRNLGSKVDLTNTMWFSYPGYNEILTGKADDARITSNDKIPNPNTTILEIANATQKYKGKVAAFGSWDVFPFIINETRSGVPVNAGFELAIGNDLTEKEQFLNALQPKVPSPWGSVRLDAFTQNYALEYLKRKHPELVYISYGETDDFAHDGNYEAYLKSAHTTDSFIKELWEFTQSDALYKNNTLFIITTDHGRGTLPLDAWRSHGSDVNGAGGTWLIAFGKGVKARGEASYKEQLFTNQIAPTLLKVLELQQDMEKMEGKPLDFEFN